MAIMTGSFPITQPTGARDDVADGRGYMKYSGLFSVATLGSTTTAAAAASDPIPVYRSLVGSEYVYTEGVPAPGFTFTTIVGFR